MATFRQHVPGFVDAEPLTGEFSTTAELLALPFLQRCSQKEGFSHFAMIDDCLMEISDEGFRWWVVGRVSDPSIVDLPKWDGGKYRAELADGTRVTLGREVVMSCGDVLTLRDGSQARNLRSARPAEQT